MFFFIVGLGNPGNAYRNSRHNAGFLVLDCLAKRQGWSWEQSSFSGQISSGTLDGRKWLLFKPETFMNRSGSAVQAVHCFYKIPLEQLLVVHDDIDLSLGRIQVRFNGGDGGHRGVQSVVLELGTADFARVRVGVGRPPGTTAAADHVLDAFLRDERERVNALIERAADAVGSWMSDGLVSAMNRFNPWEDSEDQSNRE
jgi:peptidyl-tRNA hydrolase, PTH1 family